MADEVVVLLTSIEGVEPSDGGKHALMKIGRGGQETVVAVGEENERNLLELVLIAMAQTSSKAKMTAEKLTFEATCWEIGETADGRLAMSFRLPSGAELNFVLGADQIPRMREVLQSMAPRSAASPPTPHRQKH
jgi:hypothetical protein